MPPISTKAKAGADAAAQLEAQAAAPAAPQPEGLPTVTNQTEVTGTETHPDNAAPAESVEVPPIKMVVRCHRPQGIWRAGMFWPNEDTPVLASDFTVEELQRLAAEPLLSIRPQADQE